MCIFIWVSYVHRWMECLSFLWAIPDVMSTYIRIYILYIYTLFPMSLHMYTVPELTGCTSFIPHVFGVGHPSQPNPHGAILQVLVEMSHSHEDVYEDTTVIHTEGALDAGSEAGHRNTALPGRRTHKEWHGVTPSFHTHAHTRTHTHPPYKHEEI